MVSHYTSAFLRRHATELKRHLATSTHLAVELGRDGLILVTVGPTGAARDLEVPPLRDALLALLLADLDLLLLSLLLELVLAKLPLVFVVQTARFPVSVWDSLEHREGHGTALKGMAVWHTGGWEREQSASVAYSSLYTPRRVSSRDAQGSPRPGTASLAVKTAQSRVEQGFLVLGPVLTAFERRNHAPRRKWACRTLT